MACTLTVRDYVVALPNKLSVFLFINCYVCSTFLVYPLIEQLSYAAYICLHCSFLQFASWTSSCWLPLLLSEQVICTPFCLLLAGSIFFIYITIQLSGPFPLLCNLFHGLLGTNYFIIKQCNLSLCLVTILQFILWQNDCVLLSVSFVVVFLSFPWDSIRDLTGTDRFVFSQNNLCNIYPPCVVLWELTGVNYLSFHKVIYLCLCVLICSSPKSKGLLHGYEWRLRFDELELRFG